MDDSVDTQPVRLDGLQPLVVTVQGYTMLVAEYQERMERVVKAMNLDAVTKSESIGGVDGITFLEWSLGFAVTEQDLLAGYGASYVGRWSGYSFPTIDLRSMAIQEFRRLAIQKNVEARKRTRQLQSHMNDMFGVAQRPPGRPQKRKPDRAPKKRGRPRKGA